MGGDTAFEGAERRGEDDGATRKRCRRSLLTLPPQSKILRDGSVPPLLDGGFLGQEAFSQVGEVVGWIGGFAGGLFHEILREEGGAGGVDVLLHPGEEGLEVGIIER